jgi:hypothetical protein
MGQLWYGLFFIELNSPLTRTPCWRYYLPIELCPQLMTRMTASITIFRDILTLLVAPECLNNFFHFLPPDKNLGGCVNHGGRVDCRLRGLLIEIVLPRPATVKSFWLLEVVEQHSP